MRLGTADVLVRAKTGEFERDIQQAEGKTRGFGKKASGHVSQVTKSFVLLSGAVVAVGAALGAKTIGLASDLEETQGKFDVVFRGMTASAEAWSDTMQNSFAMSETESKKYLSSIQDLLVPTGMLREEAGKLSNEFVKMAADLGSFNNRETSEVVRDIQSALQGSSETMAKYGVNVKAAKVEQEIYRLGLAGTKKQITDAHKAQAIYSIMLREGADAVGDMARTSESYANQQKKLSANFKDISTAIGVSLLPVATQLTSELNNWVKANEDLVKQDLRGYATQTATAVSYIIDAGAVLKRDFQVAGRVVAVGFQGMQLGAYQFADILYNAPIRAVNDLILLYNKIPNLPKIDFFALSGLGQDVYEHMKFLESAVNIGIGDIADILAAPFPGSSIRAALEDIGDEAEKTEKKTKDSVNEISKTIKNAFDPYELSKKQNEGFMGFMSMDDQANAAQIMHDAAEAMKDPLFDLEEVNKEVTRSIFQEWSGLLTDGLTGELNSFEDYFTGFADTISGIWADRVVAGMMENGFSAGLKSAFSGDMLGLGAAVGAMQIGASLLFGGKDSEPSFEELLTKELKTLVDTLKENTEAIKISTKEILQGADYSSAGVLLEKIKPALQKDVYENTSLIESLKLPDLYGRSGVGGVTAIAGEDALNMMFDDLFTFYQDDIGKVHSIIDAVRKGDVEPFVRGIQAISEESLKYWENVGKFVAGDLAEMPEMPENGVTNFIHGDLDATAIIDFFNSDFDITQWNTRAIADGFLAQFEEIFAQLENSAAQLSVNVGSSLDSWVSTIPGFRPDQTTRTETDGAYSDLYNTEYKQITDLLSLADRGLISLDQLDINGKTVYENLLSQKNEIDLLGTAIEEHFDKIQSATRSDITDYVSSFNDQTSALGLTFKTIEEQFAEFEEQLIDAGAENVDLIADIAAAKGAAYGAAANDALSPLTSFFSNRANDDKSISDWRKELKGLHKSMASLDSGSENYYEQSLDLFGQQVTALTNMATGLDSMATGLAASSDSVDSMLFDLTGGSMAPVQSKELIHGYYSSLYSSAYSSGDPGAIQAYLDYIPEYLSSASAWGADYGNRTDAVSGHLRDLDTIIEEKENETLEELTRIGTFSEKSNDLLSGIEGALSTSNSILQTIVTAIYNTGNKQIVVDGAMLGDIVADQMNTNTNLMTAIQGM